jgi:transcription initiation factor IIE alpha subunit
MKSDAANLRFYYHVLDRGQPRFTSQELLEHVSQNMTVKLSTLKRSLRLLKEEGKIDYQWVGKPGDKNGYYIAVPMKKNEIPV